MHSPLPFLRLANRPLVWLGWAWVTWMFAVAALPPYDAPNVVTELSWSDPAGPWFWRLAMAIPAASGMVTSFVRMDLFKGSFTWLLPGVATRMLAAMLLVSLATAIPMAVAGVVVGQPWAGLAAMCLGLLSFSLASAFIQMFSSAGLAAGALSLAGAWYWAPQFSGVAVERPLLIAAATAAAALWIHRSWSGRSGLRSLLEILRTPQEPPIVRFLQHVPTRSRTLRLHAASDATWARAARFESPVGSVRSLVLAFGVLGIVEWLVMPAGSETFMMGQLFAMACVLFPMVPRRSHVYPLSRSRRATVTWMAAAATAVPFWIAIVGWTSLFLWLAGSSRGSEVITVAGGIRSMPLLLVWYPVLLWAPIRHELSVSASQRFVRSPFQSFVWIFGTLLLFMILVESTALLLGRLELGTHQVASALLLAAAVQLVFYAALRRFFLTGDLR